MEFNKLINSDAERKLRSYQDKRNIASIISKLNDDYLKIRNDLFNLAGEIKSNYDFDLNFGLKLYKYFNEINGFNVSIASDYDVWRYISVCVVPDLIVQRHGFQPEYFYKKNVRIYLSTLWWFIHLTYQNSDEETYEKLKCLSTDYILQIVERPGKNGVYVEIMREIIRQLVEFPEEIRNQKIGGKTLIRRVMIQNTAKDDNFNLVFDKKVERYVSSLFESCNINS